MYGRLFNLLIVLMIILVISGACNSKNKPIVDNPLFHLLPASHTGIDFINKVEDTKEFNVFKYRNFYNGGGVAIGDINNDGLPDIYFSSNQHAQ